MEGYPVSNTQKKSYTSKIKSRKEILTMSVTCVDERIAPRVHYLSFRTPGACVFPRENEPSYTLAAILFFSEVAKFCEKTRIVVADHGKLEEQGFIRCGMTGTSEILHKIKQDYIQKNEDISSQINEYLTRLELYDLDKLGGIGSHAQWEVLQFEKIQTAFALESRLGKILPNDLEKEQIPNKRLVITHPFVSQEGLLANLDEQGQSFDGNTIIQTIVGIPNIHEDYNLTNGLLLFSYRKGDSVQELLVLEPIINILEQSFIRKLLHKSQQMLDITIKQLCDQITSITNIPPDKCLRYLKSIKEGTNSSLYGLEIDQLKRAKNLAEAIKRTDILPKKIIIKYGLVDVQGVIRNQKIL